MSIDDQKRIAGYQAAEYVKSGMVVGLGSGSTARFATLRIGELLEQGRLREIVAIATSNETADLAQELGIPLSDLDEYTRIDVTIDGADEVDPNLDLIKGLGGFLLWEKIVASATETEIIVIDDRKIVDRLGTRAPVPTEVIKKGWKLASRNLEKTGARPIMRMQDGRPFITDEGNYVLDCWYDGGIENARELSRVINDIPGVVENGLFLGIARRVIVASETGVRILERNC